jgi:hypothetical protein
MSPYGIHLTLLAVLGGCAPTEPRPEAQKGALMGQAWPEDLAILAQTCDEQPFPELAITCRVQGAANAAARGQVDQAEQFCAAIQEPLWKEECHFRAGESAAVTANLGVAIGHCARAGRFSRNCLTHTVWALPRTDHEPGSNAPTAIVEAAAAARATLAADPGVAGEGHDLVLAALGRKVLYGSGQPDPDRARDPGPAGAALRTGLALELLRLEPNLSLPELLAIWNNERAFPQSSPIIGPLPPGRYAPPIPQEEAAGLPHLPLFGGGFRIIATEPTVDFEVAALEAMWWANSPHLANPIAQPAEPAGSERPREIRLTLQKLASTP